MNSPERPRPSLLAPIAVDTCPLPATSSDNLKTPTRHSFPTMSNQRPLPNIVSAPLSPIDTKMENVDDDIDKKTEEDATEAGSPQDSGDADSKGNKKKKNTRFYCTQYPPCKLSFTRSEHLARHIRKHTGERPFTCHCGRRFSRLDNLRQHSQTVHINEDIPSDSPAATGSRYQRHVRTDRVRPTTGGRPRSSTYTNSINPAHQVKGHSRHLSTSSILSTISTSSSFVNEEFRRLGLDTPRSNRLSLDTPPVSGRSLALHHHFPNSPSGYSTPASTTFSMGTNSGLHSPASSVSHLHYPSSKSGLIRRLSVPSNSVQPNLNTESYSHSQSQSYMSPITTNASVSRSGEQYSNSNMNHQDVEEEENDQEPRRRTWHPNTSTGLRNRPVSSTGQPVVLTHRPLFTQQQLTSSPNVGMRLPGIETFDNLDKVPPSATMIRRVPSPMELDPPPTSHSVSDSSVTTPDDKHINRISWTNSIRNGLTNLDLSSNIKQDTSSSTWNSTASTSNRPASYHARTRSENLPSISYVEEEEEDERSNKRPKSGKSSKRFGWYAQPPSEDSRSSPTKNSNSNSNSNSHYNSNSNSSSSAATTTTTTTITTVTGSNLPPPSQQYPQQNSQSQSQQHSHQQQSQQSRERTRTSPESMSTTSDNTPQTPPVNAQIMNHIITGQDNKLPQVSTLLNQSFTPLLQPPSKPQNIEYQQTTTFRSGYPARSSASFTTPEPFGLPKVSESEGPLSFTSTSQSSNNGMDRLEALAAVATRESTV